MSRCVMAAWIVRTCAFVRAGFRPPLRPRARAARSPATVRSRMSSLSNSASAAKIPKDRRPAAVVVSICAPWPVRTLRPTPQLGESGRRLHQVMQAAPQPVELPDYEDVAFAQRLLAGFEPRTLVRLAGGAIGIDAAPRRRRRPEARRAAGRATGCRRPSRRGRSRSASFTNVRLRKMAATAGCGHDLHSLSRIENNNTHSLSLEAKVT